MAIPAAAEMLSSPRRLLCVLVLVLSGVRSSTLHLPPEQRHMLPQNTGFFTVASNEGLWVAGGGVAAAPALPLAAHSASPAASGSGAHPLHRSRRSSGTSVMPKVYGQVTCSSK